MRTIQYSAVLYARGPSPASDGATRAGCRRVLLQDASSPIIIPIVSVKPLGYCTDPACRGRRRVSGCPIGVAAARLESGRHPCQT